MKKIIVLIICLFVSSICAAKEITGEGLKDFYLMKKPTQRMEDQQTYFAHEYQQINSRRANKDSDLRPDFLTGLALSGGGIRSSAFQLGILSGLYKSNLLDRIDYISSVSGGSWANGAYWAWASSDDDFFNCLGNAAESEVNGCEAGIMLNTDQPFAKLPTEGIKLKARKRQWKEYIESIYLPKCNMNAENIKKHGIDSECAKNYRTKPYIIINTSHSVPMKDQKASPKNMPFQFTFDKLGTLSDCHSDNKECAGDKKHGFFVKTLSHDFAWINAALFRADKPENSLSAAMAASSGVVAGPMLLSYEYELLFKPEISLLGNWQGQKIKEIRKEYVLSDGGKSENLGLVPLIERGVDLIIISYMGKDDNLIENPWEDLDTAAEQVKNLLGCIVQKPDQKIDLTSNYIHDTTYDCGKHKGTILHVKASYENSKEFVKYLYSKGQDNKYLTRLHSYLTETDVKNNEDPKDRFPQTRTMMERYDEELIKSYYLFGRWIAEEHLSKIVREQQSSKK